MSIWPQLIIPAPPPRVRLTDNIRRWNGSLAKRTDRWLSLDGTSARLFSAHEVFNEILEAPVQHGFDADDPHKQGGRIWADHIHPTAKVHKIVAHALMQEWQ